MTGFVRRRLGRIIEHPSIILNHFLHGIAPSYTRFSLKAREILQEDPKTVIDVGFHTGQLTKSCLLHFPSCYVYGFDPQVMEIDVKGNFKFYPIGLGLKNEDKDFYVSKFKGSSSFLEFTEEHPQKIKGGEIVSVPIKRFDSLDIKIERPCYVKIDVEGYEYEVLKGFGDKLKEVDIIQIEVFFHSILKNQEPFWKIVKLLEEYGFNGFVQEDLQIREDNMPLYCDMFFFRYRKDIQAHKRSN